MLNRSIITKIVRVLAAIGLLGAFVAVAYPVAAETTPEYDPDGDISDLLQLTPSQGTTHYTLLIDDDEYSIVTSPIVRAKLSDLFTVTDPENIFGYGLINKVDVHYIARVQPNLNDACYANTLIRLSDVMQQAPARSQTIDYAEYVDSFLLTPDSNQWTWGNIKDLEAGISLFREPGHYVQCAEFWVTVDYTPAVTTNTGTNAGGSYDSSHKTITINGANYVSGSGNYQVAYYDANQNNNHVATNSINVTENSFTDTYLITDVNTPGTWHAVVFDSNYGTPPSTYSSSVPGIVADLSFEVEESAIPEFPTTITAIVVIGICGAIFYWRRKRRQAAEI